MKKGDIVTIYQDPTTRLQEEGKAKLIRRINGFGEELELERWTVKFLDDPSWDKRTFERWI